MRATYRLQLGPGLGFREARELVPYLEALGISHLYLSPSLQARPGSTHGYDVVDPTRVSAELGGEDELRALCTAGLDVILDVVPNHMAVGEQNPFWPEVFDVGRRFFDIDDLGGVRVEDPEVFELVHGKVLELVRAGLVDGLRIDHVDGLARPGEYLRRLHDDCEVEHLWVEKILEPGEVLRPWPVEGTTGYEFANDVTALFVEPSGEEPLSELYAELTGERRSFEEVAHEAKLEQAQTTFRREAGRLAELGGVALGDVIRALAALPVYRTYLSEALEALDLEVLERSPMPESIKGLLCAGENREFVTRFEQTTGPVMAKGVEDTAFYRFNRLVALNEVGGDPARFGLPVEEFHRANLKRAERFPLHLLATTTHDTKRSGDVRARIVALAGLADDWGESVRGWRVLDDPAEDYLLWQTLLGAWPIEQERLQLYMEKALREAKVNTNWIGPDVGHERRVREAIARFYASPPEDFGPFAARMADEGRRIALGMTLFKLTAPGVPDLYQGDELEFLALVDPDNRRPVDWDARRRALADPPPKLRVVLAALDLRRQRPDAFLGDYEPVEAGEDVCAYRRGSDVLVAVPVRPGVPKPSFSGWRDLLPELPVGLYER